ncbi:hypothetical protein J6590_036204 [Homalodisca vitripennis]|nr:hypothetical protein J6590_036204 [Homalodisca vitripennis]
MTPHELTSPDPTYGQPLPPRGGVRTIALPGVRTRIPRHMRAPPPGLVYPHSYIIFATSRDLLCACNCLYGWRQALAAICPLHAGIGTAIAAMCLALCGLHPVHSSSPLRCYNWCVGEAIDGTAADTRGSLRLARR